MAESADYIVRTFEDGTVQIIERNEGAYTIRDECKIDDLPEGYGIRIIVEEKNVHVVTGYGDEVVLLRTYSTPDMKEE